MEWIEPKYSRTAVGKAWKHIAHSDTNSQEFGKAVPVFYNWRSAHAFPMQIMLDLLRRNTIKIDRRAVVVQRLKRVGSIILKLWREKNMSLNRMEDIAGCRAVVDNIDHVTRVYEALKKSKTKNILFRERDYIASPKESGYRGIHLVFKYNGSKEKYNGMAVELQIRSRIQHSWATAVEVVGTFTKQALKASMGDAIWLDFFRYVSVEFAKLEGCPADSRNEGVNTFWQMVQIADQLDVVNRLRAFEVAAQAIAEVTGSWAGYFILVLDLEAKSVRYARYRKSELAEATKSYDKVEELHRDDETKDVVLVSAASVRDLRRAYPNYFSDTNEFRRNLRKVLESKPPARE